MVTDTLRPMFEREGLTLIPSAAGARLVIDEIRSTHAGRGPVEIVVLAERQATGPLLPSSSPGSRRRLLTRDWSWHSIARWI
jgi:hypothetical protein